MSATVKSLSAVPPRWAMWAVLGLTLFNLFFLLGHRGLNEPDEGRYAEGAREMIERGDWLVPHFYYAPHVSKPPFTYWAVAASVKLLGFSEFAVRLPVALAGLSGIAAAYLMARRLAGERAALWAVVILQTSPLYAVMSRMLTTDIFLTQFVAWAGLCLWRSLECADELPFQRGKFLLLHLAGWTAMGLGFLCKGPVAVVIPLAGVVAFLVYRCKDFKQWKWLALATVLGVTALVVVAAPWFVLLDRALPGSLRFQVFGQVLGHALGTVSNRSRGFWFFLPILAGGLLPWTPLLGWIWRARYWRSLDRAQRAGWIFLAGWVGFAFVLFSVGSAKLPAYILPVFPPLAALLAARFLAEPAGWTGAPWWTRRMPLFAACALAAGLPVACFMAFQALHQPWLWLQLAVTVAAGALLTWASRYWNVLRCVGAGVVITLLALWTLAWRITTIETDLNSNQTLRPVGAALTALHRPGDVMVIWKKLPQGLPLYIQPIVNATNQPYLVGLDPEWPPLAFPGNAARLAPRVLTHAAEIGPVWARATRLVVIGKQGSLDELRAALPAARLEAFTRSGRWELFVLLPPGDARR